MQSARIEKSGTHGRGLFANKGLQSGDEIYRTGKIFLGVLSWDKLSFTCINCFKKDGMGFEEQIETKACTQCKVMRFCGKSCQSQAWKRFHKYECKRLAESVPADGKTMVHSLQRVLVQLLLLRKHEVINDHDWKQVLELEDNFDQRSENEQSQGDWMAESTLEVCGIGDYFPKDLVKALHFKLMTNMLTMTQNDLTPIGSGLDLFISCANHSCTPNASVTMEGRRISFRALRPISKDEEILVSYIDETLPWHYRQKQLRVNYFFTCTCTLCQRGTNTPLDAFLKEFTQSPSFFQEATKAYLATHPDRVPQADRNRFKDDPNSSLLSAAEIKAHWDYNATTSFESMQRIAALEALCRTLHESQVWPLHRHPYPQARLDLIEEYNYTKQHSKALLHAAKLYFSVYPILYPSPCHPRRVMNTILLFELLVGESYQATAPNFPVDLTAALYVLGKDCSEMVKKSHGMGSGLTNTMLYGPFKQIYDELLAKDTGAFDGDRGRRAMQGLKAFADRLDF